MEEKKENIIVILFLVLSGGLQDAYSYFVRNKVFANAQTGNVILMSTHFMKLEFLDGLRYLLPIICFVIGIYVVDKIEYKYKNSKAIHWKQVIILIEIFLLFLVGFLNKNYNLIANCIVSLSCAMQVQTFRIYNNYAFASTMCIGNIRSCVESFGKYKKKKKKEELNKTLYYIFIIFSFGFAAGLGGILAEIYDIKLIWLSCIFLFVSFIFMFKQK